uniref:Uncharacterized protein n=1 Tax=Anopheles farauti TaxID=69004 RepID=A0A182QV41_9DIPT
MAGKRPIGTNFGLNRTGIIFIIRLFRLLEEVADPEPGPGAGGTLRLRKLHTIKESNAAGSRAVFQGGKSSGDQVSTGAVAVGLAMMVGTSGSTVWLGLETWDSLGLPGVGCPPIAPVAIVLAGGDTDRVVAE